MTAVLAAIALLWITSVGIWPLLAALIVCSLIWADGGTSAEVLSAGLAAWAGLLLLRRRWRRRHLR